MTLGEDEAVPSPHHLMMQDRQQLEAAQVPPNVPQVGVRVQSQQATTHAFHVTPHDGPQPDRTADRKCSLTRRNESLNDSLGDKDGGHTSDPD